MIIRLLIHRCNISNSNSLSAYYSSSDLATMCNFFDAHAVDQLPEFISTLKSTDITLETLDK